MKRAADRDQIVKFCEEYLKVKEHQDYCVNGLQVEGVKLVRKIVTGVSFSRALIEAAVELEAQMLLVHHGIFGEAIGKPPSVKGVIRERLKLLLEHNLSLCGFHLPLDAHPVIGNNAALCRLLGLNKLRRCDVGFVGELSKPVARSEFIRIIEQQLQTSADIIPAGPKTVRVVGVISGGSSPYFETAAQMGADTFLCGDLRESVVRAVEETGINLINAGHYNTEKLGIVKLGGLIAKKFKIEAEFVDIPCAV